MEHNGDLYTDDELDNEWARYVASLNQKEELDKKTRERKSIEARERETMINLQRHVRGLSRARFELEDAAIDSFDDSSSETETETGTVNILPTPISPTHDDDDDNDDNQDDDIIAPTPTESEQIIDNQSIYSPILKPISTDTIDITSRSPSESNNDPYNTKLDEIESMQDLQDSDSGDNNKLISINYNNDLYHVSSSSSDCGSSSDDEELELLKQELNQFKTTKKKNISQEQILLSVLNINHNDIDKQSLEQCTQKVINEYNKMTLKTKNKFDKNKFDKKKETISNLDPKDKLFQFPASPIIMTPIIMTPIPESPIPTINDLYHKKLKSKKSKRRSKSSSSSSSSSLSKQRNRKLADPYNEEWNGLDPDNYFWNDDVPEGECYDDKELSLRNRRIQYLVVMAIENNYCTISDLTYKQNELLLLHQQSLIF